MMIKNYGKKLNLELGITIFGKAHYSTKQCTMRNTKILKMIKKSKNYTPRNQKMTILHQKLKPNFNKNCFTASSTNNKVIQTCNAETLQFSHFRTQKLKHPTNLPHFTPQKHKINAISAGKVKNTLKNGVFDTKNEKLTKISPQKVQKQPNLALNSTNFTGKTQN